MILKQKQNTAVSAPEIDDMTTTLAAYRIFKDRAWLTVADLTEFMSIQSAEREEFLSQLTLTVSLQGKYVKKVYS